MNTETLTQTSTLVNTNNHIKVGKKKLVSGKSMCISEGHGGAGLACGPASAHCIHSKS